MKEAKSQAQSCKRDFHGITSMIFEVTRSRNCLSAFHIYIFKNMRSLRHDCHRAVGVVDKLIRIRVNFQLPPSGNVALLPHFRFTSSEPLFFPGSQVISDLRLGFFGLPSFCSIIKSKHLFLQMILWLPQASFPFTAITSASFEWQLHKFLRYCSSHYFRRERTSQRSRDVASYP